ncbi:hypothetical protein PYCC9005_001432 [Savitreella phatthalungensis]
MGIPLWREFDERADVASAGASKASHAMNSALTNAIGTAHATSPEAHASSGPYERRYLAQEAQSGADSTFERYLRHYQRQHERETLGRARHSASVSSSSQHSHVMERLVGDRSSGEPRGSAPDVQRYREMLHAHRVHQMQLARQQQQQEHHPQQQHSHRTGRRDLERHADSGSSSPRSASRRFVARFLGTEGSMSASEAEHRTVLARLAGHIIRSQPGTREHEEELRDFQYAQLYLTELASVRRHGEGGRQRARASSSGADDQEVVLAEHEEVVDANEADSVPSGERTRESLRRELASWQHAHPLRSDSASSDDSDNDDAGRREQYLRRVRRATTTSTAAVPVPATSREEHRRRNPAFHELIERQSRT